MYIYIDHHKIYRDPESTKKKCGSLTAHEYELHGAVRVRHVVPVLDCVQEKGSKERLSVRSSKVKRQ